MAMQQSINRPLLPPPPHPFTTLPSFSCLAHHTNTSHHIKEVLCKSRTDQQWKTHVTMDFSQWRIAQHIECMMRIYLVNIKAMNMMDKVTILLMCRTFAWKLIQQKCVISNLKKIVYEKCVENSWFLLEKKFNKNNISKWLVQYEP